MDTSSLDGLRPPWIFTGYLSRHHERNHLYVHEGRKPTMASPRLIEALIDTSVPRICVASFLCTLVAQGSICEGRP